MMEQYHPVDKRGKRSKSFRLGIFGSKKEESKEDKKSGRRSSTKKRKSDASSSKAKGEAMIDPYDIKL